MHFTQKDKTKEWNEPEEACGEMKKTINSLSKTFTSFEKVSWILRVETKDKCSV
jgi:hypothetical protein